MPIIEVDRGLVGSGYDVHGPFKDGEELKGKINGKEAVICVENDALVVNNVVLNKDKSFVLLDSVGGGMYPRRMIMYLGPEECAKLMDLKKEADVPFWGEGKQGDMAKMLGELYKNSLQEINGAKTSECLVKLFGQRVVAFLGL